MLGRCLALLLNANAYFMAGRLVGTGNARGTPAPTKYHEVSALCAHPVRYCSNASTCHQSVLHTCLCLLPTYLQEPGDPDPEQKPGEPPEPAPEEPGTDNPEQGKPGTDIPNNPE